MRPRRAISADLAAIEEFQHRAYAANRAVLGVEPLPLLACYANILRDHEIWIAEAGGGIEGVIVLAIRDDDLLIWSVAVEPALQGRGVGAGLLGFAAMRGHELGRVWVRLYTGLALTQNIAWYQRHGFTIERQETLPDRVIVHMVKQVA